MKPSFGTSQRRQGSSGLSLFFLRVRDEERKLNGIQVQRLKDKLGTRQMATAELWLDGAAAELVREVPPFPWDWADHSEGGWQRCFVTSATILAKVGQPYFKASRSWWCLRTGRDGADSLCLLTQPPLRHVSASEAV